MEPTNMPAKHTDANTVVPSRVHGQHSPNIHQHLPESVWESCWGFVGNVFKHLCKVAVKPDEPNESCVANHVCDRNPHRTCNCARGVCADDDATYRYARVNSRPVKLDQHNRVLAPEPNHLGNFRCPVSGQLCSATVCREWCEAGVDYTKT